MNRSLLFVCAIAHVVLMGMSAYAGEIVLSRDAETGWNVYTLRQGSTEVRVVPEKGCNAYSVKVDGVEYFDPSTRQTAKVKLKTNKRTGGIVKIQIKDATKNQVTIDLKKKWLTLVLKTTNGFDPADGVTLEVNLANQRAFMTAPARLSGKDNRKATFDPTTGIVGPVDS